MIKFLENQHVLGILVSDNTERGLMLYTNISYLDDSLNKQKSHLTRKHLDHHVQQHDLLCNMRYSLSHS